MLCCTHSAFAAGQSISVPSDSKARYTVVDKTSKGFTRIITVRRDGPSGTSFTKREVDCSRGRSRYLAEGDTMQELRANKQNNTMSYPVEGSISDYVTQAACR